MAKEKPQEGRSRHRTMVSEVGTTQWPKYEFGDDCGRYVTRTK